MKNVMAKAAGVALTAAMMLGAGGQVMASQTGDTEYHGDIRVEAHRASRYSTWSYTPYEDAFIPSDSGCYFFLTESDRAYDKIITITDTDGNVVASNVTDGTAGGFPVVLEGGQVYRISSSARDFVANSQAHDGATEYSLSIVYGYQGCPTPVHEFTLPEGLLEDHEPEVSQGMHDDHNPTLTSMEFIVDDGLSITDDIVPSASSDAPVSAQTATQTAAQTVFAPILTAEQIKTMSVRNFVGHMYMECLGRQCSNEEISNWVDMLQNRGVTATFIATSMLTSKEFEDLDVSNEEFVAILTNVFGSAVTAEDAIAALENGTARTELIGQFAASEQWASKCAFYKVNV